MNRLSWIIPHRVPPLLFPRRVVPLLLGLFCIPGAAAQTTGQPDLAQILASTPVGHPLRVVADGSTVEGTLQTWEESSILLATRSGAVRVVLAPADSLWVKRSSMKTGALIGAAVGVGLTTGLCLETFDECGLHVGLGVVTPLLALAGAGIGSLWSWKRLLP